MLVAMTGASGAILGIKLLEELKKLEIETELVISEKAEIIIKTETNLFKEIMDLSNQYNRPILIATLLTSVNSPAIEYLSSRDYPIFPSPERMVQAFRYIVN